MAKLTALGLAALAMLTLAASRDEPGANPRPVEAKSVKERFDALAKEYQDDLDRYDLAIRNSRTPEERKSASKLYPSENAYASRFLVLAQENPADPVALDALCRAIIVTGSSPSSFAEAAFKELIKHHAANPKVADDCLRISRNPNPSAEAFLRIVLAINPDRTARGRACMGLAARLYRQADVRRRRESGDRYAKELELMYGKDELDRLTERDPEAAWNEVDALLVRILTQFHDVKRTSGPRDKMTLGEFAEIYYKTHHELDVGRPLPEIDSIEISGKASPFRPSDHRGEVIVVAFWSSSNAASMAMIPQEKALLKRLAGRPFVLIGVNLDDIAAEAKAVMAKEKITWPNWFGGDRIIGVGHHYSGALAPDVFVVDAKGVIRFRNLKGDALEKAVDELLAEVDDDRK